MVYLELTPGYRTALADGVLVPDSPKHMATEEFYRAFRGSRLHLCEGEYVFAVAFFSQERNPAYIYSYAYQPEENWAVYTQNLTPQSYSQEDYIFEQEGWFRVCVKRKDDEDMNAEDFGRSSEIIEYVQENPEKNQICTLQDKPWFEAEITETISSIQQEDSSDVMKLCLLTDTHYTVNGTWEDTVHNIRRVSESVKYDAIVHLGDFTDGMLSKRLTRKYVRRMIRDLEGCRVPLYVTPGNHDCNYFRNRQNAFSEEEMRKLYRLYGNVDKEISNFNCLERNANEIDYYIDIPGFCVRMIFLSSFDDRAPIRYGYTKKQLDWLREVLYSSVSGTKFLIFSHDAPLAKLDYWSFHIRNGEKLLDILEECNAKEQYQVVGFFMGIPMQTTCLRDVVFLLSQQGAPSWNISRIRNRRVP